MSTISTSDCKKALVQYCGNMDSFLTPVTEKSLSRTRKFKDAHGQWVREFRFVDVQHSEGMHQHPIFVTEDSHGVLHCSFLTPQETAHYCFGQDFNKPINDGTIAVAPARYFQEGSTITPDQCRHFVEHLLPNGLRYSRANIFYMGPRNPQATRDVFSALGWQESKPSHLAQTNLEQTAKKQKIYYFEIERHPLLGALFHFVSQNFFDKHGHLNDEEEDILPGVLNKVKKNAFQDVGTCFFEYLGDTEEGRQLLLQAGFVEHKILTTDDEPLASQASDPTPKISKIYYFEEREGFFSIVEKDFYDQNSFFCDDDTQNIQDDLDLVAPGLFFELEEATFEYHGDPAHAKTLLIQAGFVEFKFPF